MVGSTIVAVVSDDLEAAEHLTDGEETNALGSNDATGDDLGAVDVSEALDYGGGLLGSLGGGLRSGLRKSAGVEHLLVGALPVALESLERAARLPSQ